MTVTATAYRAGNTRYYKGVVEYRNDEGKLTSLDVTAGVWPDRDAALRNARILMRRAERSLQYA